MILQSLFEKVGNTPLFPLKLAGFGNLDLLVKFEANNPTGSVKDRAAAYILRELLNRGEIDAGTTIMESTSGNFGVSLSAFCKYHGLRFIAVIDPNITPMNEMLIRAYGAETIKVMQPDQHGGYLLSRIEKIKELKNKIKNSYWVNQYANPLNAEAYYQSLGGEICSQVDVLDHVFLGVSSGGTITGVSRKIREKFPAAKVVAVDVEGSVIFDRPAKKRFIPGIGSSMKPRILEAAFIDDVVITDEVESIKACYQLLEEHSCFVGGSSGTVLAGIKKFFTDKPLKEKTTVVTVFPDRGERYYDTIYNKAWCEALLRPKNEEKPRLAISPL